MLARINTLRSRIALELAGAQPQESLTPQPVWELSPNLTYVHGCGLPESGRSRRPSRKWLSRSNCQFICENLPLRLSPTKSASARGVLTRPLRLEPPARVAHTHR